MQVAAFATPTWPGWRWRIVGYAGEIVEESSQSFPSIAVAVAFGRRRLEELDLRDVSVRGNPYRSTSHLRSR